MAKIGQVTSVLIIVFILLSLPFLLALVLPNEVASTPFSIYNEDWNGLSELKKMFEDYGAQIKTIIGSTNALNRLNETLYNTDPNGSTLIIIGPTLHYDPSESIAILLFIMRGGRVLIADDFGTGNDILSFFSMILGAMSQIPMEGFGSVDMFGFQSSQLLGESTNGSQQTTPSNTTFINPIVGIAFNGSLLMDTTQNVGSPAYPVFKPIASQATGTNITVVAPWVQDYVKGINNGIVGNFATALTMKVKYPENTCWTNPQPPCELIYHTIWVPMGGFPAYLENLYLPPTGQTLDISVNVRLEIGVLYSSRESWLEANITQAKRDLNSVGPNTGEWAYPQTGFPVFVSLPLGDAGALMLAADPSIFINLYLNPSQYDAANAFGNYDNRQFAQNVIEQLMKGRPNQLVIFDESHLAHSPLSPILPISIYLRFLDLMTMFPLFAPILPLAAFGLARKYVPKKTTSKPLLVKKVQQYYGKSFFATKMAWFLQYQHYKRGLELLYRRLRRSLIRRYDPNAEWDFEIFAEYLTKEFPNLDYKMLIEGFNEIETVLLSNNELTEEEFLKHYLFIKTISDVIS